MTAPRLPRPARPLLRLVAAAGLTVVAYVHADLAPAYDGVRASVSEGDLFRVEAGVAAAAALIVLLAGRRAGFGLAFAVAVGALGALLLYRYADVGRLGPLPDMYEPSWSPEKAAAAVAAALAVVASGTGLVSAVRHREVTGRHRRLALTVVSGVVAGLAVAGFAGRGAGAVGSPPGGAAPGTQHVTIAGNNALRFVPVTTRLRTGTVRITLRDSGAYPHNIVIPALHFTSPTVTGDPGGVDVSFTVTFRTPGRYRFYCQYHASAGMTGTLLVR